MFPNVHGAMASESAMRPPPTASGTAAAGLAAYLWSVATVTLATGVAWILFHHVAPTNLVMVYLLGVLLVATRFGRGPAVLASLLSVATFDFLFVPPYHSFAVDDTEYLITFGIMLSVALITSGLMLRIREHALVAGARERRTSTLYRMSREFSRAVSREDIVRIAEEKVGELLAAEVWVFLRSAEGVLEPGPGLTSSFPPDEPELRVARWVFQSGQPAGRGTEAFPESAALYVPLVGARGVAGVLGIFESDSDEALGSERRQLLDAIAGQLALVVERTELAQEAEATRLRLETERLRETLLSAASHDLRTPLATIAGAASGLIASDEALDRTTRLEMLQSIWDEAERLNRLVSNLLSMTRLRAGAAVLRKEWLPLDEVIGSALAALRRRLADHEVRVQAPDSLPLLLVDGVLVEQVLVNLIENATRHAGGASPIEIVAEERGGEVVVSVADRGPGIPAGDEEEIFERLSRAGRAYGRGGAGLGLAICREIVEAHGGRIWASRREGGGAIFSFTLPVEGNAPRAGDDGASA